MRSIKRLSTYLLGAGLALSVAALAPVAFAQDPGTIGSTSGSTAPNSAVTPSSGAAANNSTGMAAPSGPNGGSDNSAANPNSAASSASSSGSDNSAADPNSAANSATSSDSTGSTD